MGHRWVQPGLRHRLQSRTRTARERARISPRISQTERRSCGSHQASSPPQVGGKRGGHRTGVDSLCPLSRRADSCPGDEQPSTTRWRCSAMPSRNAGRTAQRPAIERRLQFRRRRGVSFRTLAGPAWLAISCDRAPTCGAPRRCSVGGDDHVLVDGPGEPLRGSAHGRDQGGSRSAE
jgi:hypothetical protein